MADSDKYKTPVYTRNAAANYYNKNRELINQKRKEKYNSLSKEQKAEFISKTNTRTIIIETGNDSEPKIEKLSRYQLMTDEQKEIYKSKRREYNLKKKEQKQQQLKNIENGIEPGNESSNV